MEWFIPGTVLKADKASNIEQQFSAMFLGGGIVLSQVTGITGLEAGVDVDGFHIFDLSRADLLKFAHFVPPFFF